MASGIPQDETAAISIALEGILYGFSILMFIGTFWALTRNHRVRDVNRPMAVAAILLLMLSTAHMIVDMVRVENGFVKYRDTYPGGPAAYFADITQPLFVTKNLILTLQTMVGDGVLVGSIFCLPYYNPLSSSKYFSAQKIYRCFVVWQSIWIIVLPVLLWCSAAVTGILAPYRASQATTNATDIYAKATSQWVTAYFASSLATNLLGTGLLAYRIWTIERSVSGIRTTKSPTMHILRVLMDAAIMFSVSLFIALVCFVISNNGELVMLYMVPPIISIAFYMVFIRIAIRGQNRSHRPATTVGGSTNEMDRGDLRIRPLHVHISQFTQHDTAYEMDQEGPSSKAEFVEALERVSRDVQSA